MDFDLTDPAQAALVADNERNNERIRALAQRGLNFDPGRPGAVIEFLLDHLAGLTPERLRFERAYQDNVASLLDQVETQIRLQQLVPQMGVDPNVLRDLAEGKR